MLLCFATIISGTISFSVVLGPLNSPALAASVQEGGTGAFDSTTTSCVLWIMSFVSSSVQHTCNPSAAPPAPTNAVVQERCDSAGDHAALGCFLFDGECSAGAVLHWHCWHNCTSAEPFDQDLLLQNWLLDCQSVRLIDSPKKISIWKYVLTWNKAQR